MSIQIIFYFGFILGVVLFSAYCASIVSALTNPLNLVTSIQDLINLEHFLLVDSNTKIEAFLETVIIKNSFYLVNTRVTRVYQT